MADTTDDRGCTRVRYRNPLGTSHRGGVRDQPASVALKYPAWHGKAPITDVRGPEGRDGECCKCTPELATPKLTEDDSRTTTE